MELKDQGEIGYALKLFLWVAIIQHAEAFSHVSGPEKGVYTLDSQALDWTDISYRANSLLDDHPDHELMSYLVSRFSKSECCRRYYLCRQRHMDKAFLYEVNWNRLRSKLKVTSRAISRKLILEIGGIPPAWVGTNNSNYSISSPGSCSKIIIRNRIERIALAEFRARFTPDAKTIVDLNNTVVQVFIPVSDQFTVIESLTDRVIQQLRRDWALETELTVEMDDAAGNSLAFTVSNILLTIIVILRARGVSSDQWDSWAALEVLNKGWTERDEEAESLPVNDLTSGIAHALVPTHQPDARLDETQKAGIRLLQSDAGGLWPLSTGKNTKAENQYYDNEDASEPDDVDMNQEHEAADDAFHLLDLDGTPLNQHVLCLREKKGPLEKKGTRGKKGTRPLATKAVLTEFESNCDATKLPPSNGLASKSTLVTQSSVSPSHAPLLQPHSPPGVSPRKVPDAADSKARGHKRKTEASDKDMEDENGGRKKARRTGKKACDRCGQLLFTRDHEIQCVGRCNNCQANSLVCKRSLLGVPKASCQECKDKNLKCEGASHSHLAKQVKCPKCGVPGECQGRSDHQRICCGCCSNCRQAGEPCRGKSSNKRSKGCSNCLEKGEPCDKQFMPLEEKPLEEKPLEEKPLAPEVICPRCGLSSRSPWFNRKDFDMDRHIFLCVRCARCDDLGIPCQRHHSEAPCETCRESGVSETCLASSGKIKWNDYYKTIKETCTGCGVEHPAGALPRHQEKCKGKCTRCTELGLSCPLGVGKPPCKCRNCQLAKTVCSHIE